MENQLEAFSKRIGALRTQEEELAKHLAEAAQSLKSRNSGVLGTANLVTILSSHRKEFDKLREELLTEAQRWQFAPLPEADDLEAILNGITARQQQTQAVKDKAGAVVARLLQLRHREQTVFAPLEEFQRSVRQVERTLAESSAEALAADAVALAEGGHPYCEVLQLAGEFTALADEQWEKLRQSVVERFGLALAIAAARGKLEVAADATPVVNSNHHPAAAGDVAPVEPAGVDAKPQAASLEPPTNDIPPESADDSAQRGQKRAVAGDEVGALTDLHEAILRNKSSAEHYLERGRLFFRRANLDRAIEDFSTALDLCKPGSALAGKIAYWRGLAYLGLSEPVVAISDLDDAQEAIGIEAIALGAVARLRSGNLKNTDPLFVVADAQARAELEKRGFLGFEALRGNDLPEAQRQFGKAVQAATAHPAVMVELAGLYLEEGQTGAARPLLEKALAAGWIEQSLFRWLGKLREQSGDFEGAVEVWRLATRLDPSEMITLLRKRAETRKYSGPDPVGAEPGYIAALRSVESNNPFFRVDYRAHYPSRFQQQYKQTLKEELPEMVDLLYLGDSEVRGIIACCLGMDESLASAAVEPLLRAFVEETADWACRRLAETLRSVTCPGGPLADAAVDKLLASAAKGSPETVFIDALGSFPAQSARIVPRLFALLNAMKPTDAVKYDTDASCWMLTAAFRSLWRLAPTDEAVAALEQRLRGAAQLRSRRIYAQALWEVRPTPELLRLLLEGFAGARREDDTFQEGPGFNPESFLTVLGEPAKRVAPSVRGRPELANVLFKELATSDDLLVRATAVAILGEIGGAVAGVVDALATALIDPRSEVRCVAAVVLGRLGQDAAPAVAGLIECLKSNAPEVQVAAARALAQLGESARPAVPTLLSPALLESPKDNLRDAVFEALEKCAAADPAVVRRLQERFTAPTALDRVRAAGIVWKLTNDRTLVGSVLLENLQLLPREGTQFAAAQKAVAILSEMGPAALTFRDALRAKLNGRGYISLCFALAKCLWGVVAEDPQRDTIRTELVNGVFVSCLRHKDAGSDAKIQALELLTEFGPTAAVAEKAIYTALDRNDAKLYAAAARALQSVRVGITG